MTLDDIRVLIATDDRLCLLLSIDRQELKACSGLVSFDACGGSKTPIHGLLALPSRLQYDSLHAIEWVILEGYANSSSNHLSK